MSLFKCIFIAIALFQFIGINAQDKKVLSEEKIARLDSISKNPSGKIYFLDKKSVTERDYFEVIMKEELKGRTSFLWEGRQAIIIFGERARNGIIFGESNREEQDEDQK